MIFVKWKEGLWCRASVVDVLQKGCVEAVKACPVSQLASIRVFFLDYGLTQSFTIQRYTHSELRQRLKPFYSDNAYSSPKKLHINIKYMQQNCLTDPFLSFSVECCSKLFLVHHPLFSHILSSEEETTQSSLEAVNNHLRKVGEEVNVELGYFAPQAIRCSLKDLVPYDLVRPLRFEEIQSLFLSK